MSCVGHVDRVVDCFITDYLRSLELDEVRTDIAGHGIVGVLRGGKPGDQVIALRADIDALPVEELVDVDSPLPSWTTTIRAGHFRLPMRVAMIATPPC